jgi:hypothetical protein
MLQVNRIIKNIKIWVLVGKKTVVATASRDPTIAKWKNILVAGNQR